MSVIRKNHRHILRLTTDALLAALLVVFSMFLTIPTPIMKISFNSLPVLLCAFYCGMPDAVAVALIGKSVEQVILYGLDFTTPFWIAPFVLMAVCAGLMYKYFYQKKESPLHLFLIILVCELVLTLTNTLFLILLGKVIVGELANFLLVVLPMRLLPLVGRLVITGTVLPLAIPALNRTLPLRAE